MRISSTRLIGKCQGILVGAVLIIGSLLFVFWLSIWWGTRPNYEPHIRHYEAVSRQLAVVNAEIERAELLLDIARASNNPAYDDFEDRLYELFDKARATLDKQETVAKELPRGYLEQRLYREQVSPAEIQAEQNTLLAASTLMALGGMMMSDQPNPFHHH